MIESVTYGIPDGWYTDPDDPDRQRYFSDDGWSPWVSSRQGMTLSPLVDDDTPDPSGIGVTREILRQAQADGVIDSRTLGALLRYTQRWSGPPPAGSAKPVESARAATTAPAWEPDAALWSRSETAPGPAAGPTGATPTAAFPAQLAPRSPLSRWWHETRETVKSDLAVHGLAYLGVLLLFAGVFGLVVWSFSDINSAMRPVAELAIPGALFAGAAMLNRRGTRVVAGALEVAGGLLLPIVAVASFVDDAPVPPDPTGVSLTVALAVTTFAIAIGYAVWVRLHPTSTLAYLVAPVAWLSVGLLSLSWLDPVPQGESVAAPRALETAVMAVAAGATLLAARLRPQLPLASATLTSGPVALAVLALLSLLAGSADGWPSTPAVVSAVGITAGLEALDRRLPGPTLTIATSVTVGLGLLAARSGLDSSPWVTVLAFAAATGWAEYHRRRATGGERRTYTVAAGLFPIGVVAGAIASMGWPNGSILTALLLLVLVALLRVRLPAETFWPVWVAAASGGLALALAVASTVQVQWPAAADSAELEGSWQAPLAALLLAVTIGAARTRYAAPATWAVVAVLAEAWWLGLPFLGVADDKLATGWALAAAGTVIAVLSLPVAWRGRATTPVLGHLTVAALALGVLAVVVAGAADPWSSARMAVVTAAAALAWLSVSLVDERRETEAVTVARTWFSDVSDGVVRSAPAAVAATLLAGAIGFTVDASDRLTDDAWWPAVAGAIALAYVVFARVTVGALPRNSRVAAEASLLLAVTSLVLGVSEADTAARFVPAAITFALVIAVAVAVPGRWRDSRPAWLGWAASAALTVVVVDQIGAERGDWPMTVMVWGSVTALSALAIERLPAAASLRTVVQRTLPPVALGTSGLALGALTVAVTESFSTTGWWFLLVTVTALAAGALTGEGRLIGAAAAAFSVSYTALAPWDPVDHPSTIVLLGAIWLTAADVTRRWSITRNTPHLTTSLFLVGQLVVVAALPLVAVEDQRPLGLVLAGLVSIGVAVRVPVAGARPWYGGLGAVLILVGAADEGLGWLAAALAALSAGATAAAAVGRGLSARATASMRVLGAASAAAAWATFVVWAEWTAETSIIVTALGTGLLLAGLGVAVQMAHSLKPWVEVWGGVALLLLLTSAWGLSLPDLPRAPAAQLVSAGMALAAIAMALAAEPLRRDQLRIITVLLAWGAAGSFLYGIRAEAQEIATAAVLLAIASTLAIAVTGANGRGVAWRPALLLGSLIAAGTALLAGAVALPDRAPLVGVFVVVAAQCVVIGRVIGSTGLLVAGPPLLSLSWMLYASEALSGNPQWYLVPVGLALIVMAALLRWTRRQAGKEIGTTDVVALELAGVAFIAGPTLVQTATDSLGYALLAIVEGVLVSLWGAVTKVRRRLAAGVGVVVAAVVLLVAVPLLPMLPEWRGAALWVAVAGLGLAAIIIATFIERGRAKVGAWVASLSETLSDWE